MVAPRTPRTARPFRTPSLSARLQMRNTTYRKKVEQTATSPGKGKSIAELQKERKTHFGRLRKVIPFLKPLLEKSLQIPLVINVSGTRYGITILGRGYSMTKLSRPVVVVLDSAGRAHLFYKSTGINSRKPGKWIPFDGIRMTKQKDGTREPWYVKYNEHLKLPEYYERISVAIKSNERNISFIETNDIDLVNAVKTYI